MQSAGLLEDDDGGGLPTKAVVAGLAVLCAAALAVGALDRAPLGRWRGQTSAAVAAGPAVAAGRHGPAHAESPRLSFHGPGGEILDFPGGLLHP